jgi:hypothetical protein
MILVSDDIKILRKVRITGEKRETHFAATMVIAAHALRYRHGVAILPGVRICNTFGPN